MTASVIPSGCTPAIQNRLSVFRAVFRNTISYSVLRNAWTRLWLPRAQREPLSHCSAVCGCPLSALWLHLLAASVSSNTGRCHVQWLAATCPVAGPHGQSVLFSWAIKCFPLVPSRCSNGVQLFSSTSPCLRKRLPVLHKTVKYNIEDRNFDICSLMKN